MGKRAADTDVEIGRRIRLQRLAKRMSQTGLGDACGITFQQIQKYEKGVNRVGGSRLQQIADALSVAPAFFFGASGAGEDRSTAGETDELLVYPGAIQLLRHYAKLPSSQRKAIVRLTGVLVGEMDAEA
jgi:transcriptional regulator with XRE-family HTH domain